MPVGINGVDKQSVGINGVQVKQTLNAANETVSKGVYDATTLSTVDADLATANIKNGITIFGKVGSADVHDISDATAIEAEVLAPETFYAVGGGIRTGIMPTVAITAVNDNYPAGYHAGDVGGLSAIDVNLAAANILSGVNIFGFVGVATVQDIADANALVGNVKDPKTFYSVTGARKTGTMPTVALAPGSSAYPAGYHAGDGGGLPAIDADLATANIKNGITIFNIAGSVDVRDVSDANALIGEVMDGRTFYAVGGAIKTGTMVTQTLNPANENVLAGYYAATTLSAVDAQLAASNIKSGINIFGFVGAATVQDISDANALVGDVKDPKTFYSVTGARKTGTMATVAIVAANDDYPAGYHAGNVGGLDAIDADLAPENIRLGATIFGKIGTVVAGGAETYEVESSGDLAQFETYTPTDPGIYFLASWVNYYCSYQYYSTTSFGWYHPGSFTGVQGTGISDGTNMRIRANNVCEYILLRQYYSTGTYERYADVNLGAGASITPADGGIFTWGAELNTGHSNVNYATHGWDQAYDVSGLAEAVSPLIGDGANIRCNASTAGVIVMMRAVMV